MYYKEQATTAETEVKLLRVLSSTLNTENEKLAEQLRQVRLESAKYQLKNEELQGKIKTRNKIIAIIGVINITVIAVLALT